MIKRKFFSVFMIAALMAGVVAFSACKDEEEKLTPTSLAKEFCACVKLPNDTAIENCLNALFTKYEKQLDAWDESESAFLEILTELAKCDGPWEEWIEFGGGDDDDD